ncbi:restriction endonuclease subunit S [Flavobacterium sp. F372]|uniref:Restriction endonuclease subunit S n=1 Tax=Flavobacterium bernardetii TaxID=2813823 RepID=A0ABR7IV76_9FLAO|nr:restriction endonuclease subunit S [Flavobacterium bernardetii]MBC5833683.1 restriction endonuclease subunit S [Flavobacterium bernardetii]NHF68916.1 restriction endonuclease subunit S [Flavobacterium bernardetii]
MPNNWKTYKLSELTTKIGSGATPRGGQEAYKSSGISLIRSQNVLDFTFSTNGLAFIDDVQATKLNNVTLEENDILLNITGDSVARVCKVPNEFLPARVNQHVAILRADSKILNPDYLLYSLLEKSNKDKLLTLASAGATRNAITKSMIENFEVVLPDLKEQKSIAEILSSIDEKIENNLAINKTLEEMAMALYKHWFVDFGPFQEGEFVDSELGKIPEGWEVKRLVEFVNLAMGQSPKSEFYNLNKDGLPFHQGVTNYGERFPEDKTYSTEGNRFAEDGDILFSVRAPVGRLNIAKNKIILGRGLSSMTLKNYKNNGFLFYSLKNFFTEDDIIGDGTVYGSVNKTELENLKFIVPCKEILEDFNDLVKDIDSKYLNNYKENQTLTQLRDTLLPKLISGEVRLKEFRESITN